MGQFRTDDTGLRLGAAYYPEQWPRSMWAEDYQRMHQLGFSVVRMGEFAWSIFEPSEGNFSFDLFDRAIDLAHSHDLLVVLGTPTATPPAWLTHRYPEVLNVRQDGVRYHHGQRRHYNYSAPIYHELSARLVRRLVEHYRNHPAVLGWQIDNEINCEVDVFYADADHLAFRQWLTARYGSLTALNEAWGTVFWNQTYDDWDQVHLTLPTPSASPNPHQLLDEKRFISDSARAFVSLQAGIIRSAAPHQFVTTNGLFGHLDSHRMTEEALDWISYDSYPNFARIQADAGPDDLHDRNWSKSLSIVRDISPNFWVMEQQAGPGGWVNRMQAPSPKPGQMRLWTYQSVAHGADAVLYFRWRTATMGTEIYWHGLNDYGNRANRRTAEAGQVGEEFGRISTRLVNTQYRAEVALVRDYDNEWDGEFDRWVGPLRAQSERAWNAALQRGHIPMDVHYVKAEDRVESLVGYRLLIYPHPTIMSTTMARLLSEYVRAGGTLIVGCRSGYKDLRGQCYMRPLPGALAELVGIEVEDFTLIGPEEAPPKVVFLGDSEGTESSADGFNEILRPVDDTVEVLALYRNAYYAGKPACTRRRVGQGTVYYYGAVFNQTVVERMVHLSGVKSPADGVIELPTDIELAIRGNSQREIWFLLNYSARAERVDVRRRMRNILTDVETTGSFELPPYDVMLLERAHEERESARRH